MMQHATQLSRGMPGSWLAQRRMSTYMSHTKMQGTHIANAFKNAFSVVCVGCRSPKKGRASSQKHTNSVRRNEVSLVRKAKCLSVNHTDLFMSRATPVFAQ
jgi:hypothetical protein